MKIKKFLPLCVLFVFAAGLMGCSDDDDDSGIVRESVVTDEVRQFFEAELAPTISSLPSLQNGFFRHADYEDLHRSGTPEVLLRVINSTEEFRAAYLGTSPLPDIDFSQHTLVIGLTDSRDSSETLGRVRLREDNSSYTLAVVIYKNVNPILVYNLQITPLFFWKLYPKCQSKQLTATRVIEEVYQ